MKTLTVLLVAYTIGTSGYLIQVPTAPTSQVNIVTAPAGWVHIQKMLLPLFENVCEESNNPMVSRLAQDFVQNPSSENFTDVQVLTAFQNLKSSKGLLAKGEIFSEYNPDHMNELKIIYDMLFNAKNFDTFYKIAAWARQNVNCGLFVNAIYLAIENRRDTEKVALPPPYEILPNYFIRKDIIIQGSAILAGEDVTLSENVRDEGNAYTLDANYTASIYDNDDVSKLAYFREDVGLNSYYFLKMLKLAPWLNEDINSNYGEEIYYMMKQFLARYNLERYSNQLPEQENFNWDSVLTCPYDPMLIYSNGNNFISRMSSLNFPETEDKTIIKTIENNIPTIVSHMRQSGYNKTQILNHLMEILVTGERSYDSLARHLLGKDLSNNGRPSVLEHYMTSLRDPMFWKLTKNLVDLVDNALKILPPYARNELFFPGVELMSIDVKKMMTNMDYFEFDITEALKIGNGDTTFQVKIGQPRLNHKPFSVKLNISSLVTQKGLVKLYLGPKMLPGEFAKKKNLFTLFDCFEINLKKGSNIVTRNSDNMKQFSPDFLSLKTLRTKVQHAEFGLDSLPLNNIDSQIGFPSRLIVPKGSIQGQSFQIVAFVAPFIKATFGLNSITSMELNAAILSPLYPFDLPIEDNFLLGLPNALVKDVIISHKALESASNSGSSQKSHGTYDGTQPNAFGNSFNTNRGQFVNNAGGNLDEYSVLPLPTNENIYEHALKDDASVVGNKLLSGYDYASKRKQPFDYESKRTQYVKKNVDVQKTDDSPVVNVDDIDKEVQKVGNQIEEMQKDDAFLRMTPVLKSSFDYSTKRKNYDYKAKKELYGKKFDYKQINKDKVKYTTTQPILEPIIIPENNIIDNRGIFKVEPFMEPIINVPNSVIKPEIFDQIEDTAEMKNKDSMIDKVEYVGENDMITEIDKDMNIRPMPFIYLLPNKSFTIYDYIIHAVDNKDNSSSEEDKET